MWTYACECNVCMCPAYMSVMYIHVCECNSEYIYLCVCVSVSMSAIYVHVCECNMYMCALCVGAMYCMCVLTSAQRSEDNRMSCFYHSLLYSLELWSLTEPGARLAISKAQKSQCLLVLELQA